MRTFHMDFVGNRKKLLTFAAVCIALVLVASVLLQARLDIAFKGGALITYSYEGEIDRDSFKAVVEETLGEQVSLQESVDVATGSKNFVVSLAAAKGISADKQLELAHAVSEQYAQNHLKTASVNVVNPTIGAEFLAKCVVALAFAALLMVLYISLRFRKISGWSAGVTALLALLNDMIMVFGAFVFFRFSIDANFIAVCLTILGYSLNDTIVIYDRIRENKRIYGNTMSIADLVNLSLNQSWMRSLMTSVTTITAMAVVSVVAALYSVGSILSFSLPMIAGMAAGFFSSTCIAPNLWVLWQQKKAAR